MAPCLTFFPLAFSKSGRHYTYNSSPARQQFGEEKAQKVQMWKIPTTLLWCSIKMREKIKGERETWKLMKTRGEWDVRGSDHINKKRMESGVPPDPVVVKGGYQFGNFHVSLQHHLKGRRLATVGDKAMWWYQALPSSNKSFIKITNIIQKYHKSVIWN